MSVVDCLLELANKNITPLVPLRGSISASGDLAPLSYIASFLIGKEFSLGKYQGKTMSATSILESIGMEPQKLQAKEGLSIVNSTSLSAVAASLNIYDSHILCLFSQALTALSVECMNGTSESFDAFIHAQQCHPGQVEVANNLYHMLDGSKMLRTSDDMFNVGSNLRQDRYSLRTAAQWIGPQVETVMKATNDMNIHLNSSMDNPLCDTKKKRFLHGGNFQAEYAAIAMDNTRIGLQALAKIMFAQNSELMNKHYSNGLTPVLAWDEPSLDYGIKGVETAMAAYMSEIAWLASPVSNHVQSAEQHNQGVNSLAFLSSRQTSQAVDVLSIMVASHLYALLQGVDIRAVSNKILNTIVIDVIPQSVKSLSLMMPESQTFEKQLVNVLCDEWKHNLQLDSKCRFDAIVTKMHSVLYSAKSFGSMQVAQANATIQQWHDDLVSKMVECTATCKNEYVAEGAALLGRTKNLYNFVRFDLNVKVNKGQTYTGGQIDIILDSIKKGTIFPALLACFDQTNAHQNP